MLVEYDGPSVVQANALFWATIKVTLEETIRPGGRIVVAARHVSDFGQPQIKDPKAENFVSILTSRDGVEWEFEGGRVRYRHPWNRGVDLTLTQGTLSPGDVVTIELGGEEGFRCQSFEEEGFALRVGVLPEAEADWVVTPLKESPGWRIIGQEAVAVRVRVPDVNSEQGGGSLCVKLEDTYGNPSGPCEVGLKLLLDDDGRAFCQRVDLSQGMTELQDVPRPADGEWHYLTAVSEDGRLFGRSNPFGPSLLEGYRLYWGDLHAMSGQGAGTGTPEHQFRYGRQAAGLDFAAVTSVECLSVDEDFEEVKRAAEEAHRPGRFVTFPAYELSNATARGGDHNIYFLGGDPPMLRQGVSPEPSKWERGPMREYAGKTRSVADVIAEYGERPVLAIPHCGGVTCNFDLYNAEKMPVFEIHSTHRNHEDMAHEAIRRGLKFGFIGGSDDHRGALGDSVPAARDYFFAARNGLMGVYARELTREGIWEAIFARRVYATNGCRMALGFTANGAPMGSEIEVDIESEVRFRIDVVTDGYFDHAELVCETEEEARFIEYLNQARRFGREYVVRARPGTTAFHVRVYQVDGGIAWSSPIWVTAKLAYGPPQV